LTIGCAVAAVRDLVGGVRGVGTVDTVTALAFAADAR
jgi:hypothetical protein